MRAPDLSVPPAPWGPTPSDQQLLWHEYEYYGFVHFTTNTFTGREWGTGGEDPAVFNPSELDARQWAQTARDAGMKGLILTAKHHDGFCLWPSEHTEHSVKTSPWRGGKGDVVRELSDACKEVGIRFGIYLSPWDRNHVEYGTPAYVDYYRAQLDEVTSQYGKLFELWFDGANGGTGYYGGANEERQVDRRTYYGFTDLWDVVRRNQPGAVIFSDAGPDIRWVGNESGVAPDVCWCRVNPEGIYPGEADVDRLARGESDGQVWRPAEVDVSIRKGWFYHPEESPKSAVELMDIYMESVGKGCCLLLNLTPDRRGLIPDVDIASLRAWKSQLDALYAHELTGVGGPHVVVTASSTRGCESGAASAGVFAASNTVDGDPNTYWATDDGVTEAALTVTFAEAKSIGLMRVEEYIKLGQRVKSFSVSVRVAGTWRRVVDGGTIGPRRLVNLGGVSVDAVRVELEGLACPTISRLAIYRA